MNKINKIFNYISNYYKELEEKKIERIKRRFDKYNSMNLNELRLNYSILKAQTEIKKIKAYGVCVFIGLSIICDLIKNGLLTVINYLKKNPANFDEETVAKIIMIMVLGFAFIIVFFSILIIHDVLKDYKMNVEELTYVECLLKD